MLDEESPLDHAPTSQWKRDRVEADLHVCSHFGGPLQIAVLRFAEILAPVQAEVPPGETEAEVCEFVEDLVERVRRERKSAETRA